MSENSSEEIIQAGLRMTCISRCDLYEWAQRDAGWKGHLKEFTHTIEELIDDGVVYEQRWVDCRVHSRGSVEPGVALVDGRAVKKRLTLGDLS